MQLRIRYPPKKKFLIEIKKIAKFKTFKQLELWQDLEKDGSPLEEAKAK